MRRAQAWLSFETNTLHRQDGREDEPLSRAEVDSIFEHLPATGAMWIEKHEDGRHLFVNRYAGGSSYDLGLVESNVRRGTRDLHPWERE